MVLGGLFLSRSNQEVAVDGHRDDVIRYHLHLLNDAVFLGPVNIKKHPSRSSTSDCSKALLLRSLIKSGPVRRGCQSRFPTYCRR